MENILSIKKPCGCGGKCKPKQNEKETTLTDLELEFINTLLERTSIPVVKFTITSKVQGEEEEISQGPVYIKEYADDADIIEKRGNALISLANKGMVTIAYEEILQNGNYEIYKTSELFKNFVQNSQTSNFEPGIKKGIVSITEKGIEAL